MKKKIMVILTAILLAATVVTTCCITKETNNKCTVTNCYGETIDCVIIHGQLCSEEWGTPLMYCDVCHGVTNGRGQYEFAGKVGCERCIDELFNKWKAENVNI